MEFAEEEDAGEGPVAFDGAGRDVEEGGNLFDGEAAEVAQLDDLALAGVEVFEAEEGFIEEDDVVEFFGGDGEVVVELDALEVAIALQGVVGAGVVDQDAAHDVGGDGDEVLAVVPLGVFAGEAEVGFVDEGGGLEGVVGALAAHVGGGEAMEFGVDEGKEFLSGVGVAFGHLVEEQRDFAWVRVHGVTFRGCVVVSYRRLADFRTNCEVSVVGRVLVWLPG